MLLGRTDGACWFTGADHAGDRIYQCVDQGVRRCQRRCRWRLRSVRELARAAEASFPRRCRGRPSRQGRHVMAAAFDPKLVAAGALSAAAVAYACGLGSPNSDWEPDPQPDLAAIAAEIAPTVVMGYEVPATEVLHEVHTVVPAATPANLASAPPAHALLLEESRLGVLTQLQQLSVPKLRKRARKEGCTGASSIATLNPSSRLLHV